MQIPRSRVVEHLRSLGEHDRAAQAGSQLPDPVDPDAHADVLSSLGIDPVGLGDAGGAGDEAGAGSGDRDAGSSPRDAGTADEALDADGTLTGEPASWGGSDEHGDGNGGLAGGLGGAVR